MALSINATNAYDKLMYIVTTISKDEGSDKVFMKCLTFVLKVIIQLSQKPWNYILYK